MGRPIIDLTGIKFDRWTVLRRDGFKGKSAAWLCECDCGNIKTISSGKLRERGSRSCGCFATESTGKRATIHGHMVNGVKPSSEYRAWSGMKHRCTNHKNKHYNKYGGRGIIICDRWINSYANFIQDMGFKPTQKHSLDRIDNNGNYEPSNCRWTTIDVQNENRRSTRWIEHDGKKLSLSSWARILDIPNSNLCDRLKNRTIKEVFEFYEKKRNS